MDLNFPFWAGRETSQYPGNFQAKAGPKIDPQNPKFQNQASKVTVVTLVTLVTFFVTISD